MSSNPKKQKKNTGPALLETINSILTPWFSWEKFSKNNLALEIFPKVTGRRKKTKPAQRRDNQKRTISLSNKFPLSAHVWCVLEVLRKLDKNCFSPPPFYSIPGGVTATKTCSSSCSKTFCPVSKNVEESKAKWKECFSQSFPPNLSAIPKQSRGAGKHNFWRL